ncbi:unnamed protein product [Phaeothamnion confervicola]
MAEAERETREELEKRHKSEIREYAANSRALIKKANKNKKKVEEAEAAGAQMAKEMKERHAAELAQLEARTEGGASSEAAEPTSQAAAEPTSEAAATDGAEADAAAAEEDAVEAAAESLESLKVGEDDEAREKAKRDKARAKKQAKARKKFEEEQERERRIAEEKAASGPDPRDTEMAAISARMLPLGLRVAEIKADGHCLYRAVAAQLRLAGIEPRFTEESFPAMRCLAAAQMRRDPDGYAPFLEAADDGGFEQHCAAVEGSAEWGGQVELRALAAALRMPIEVFSADAPLLVLGEEFGDGGNGHGPEPLRVSFHNHYYSLGAHYNSVVPL